MSIDKTKITKEMLEKAAKCETAEELIALVMVNFFGKSWVFYDLPKSAGQVRK